MYVQAAHYGTSDVVAIYTRAESVCCAGCGDEARFHPDAVEEYRDSEMCFFFCFFKLFRLVEALALCIVVDQGLL